MTSEPLTLTQLPWALAGATVPCTHLREDGSPQHEKLPENGEYRCDACIDQPIPGRIWLFGASVRLPCPCPLGLPMQSCLPCIQAPNHSFDCLNCHGLDWKPTKDGWWEAAREAGIELYVGTSDIKVGQFYAEAVPPNPGEEEFYVHGYTEAEARNRALLAAVLAMPGVTLGEVQPGE